MPQELNLLEEYDILTELQFPEYVFSTDSLEEQIALSLYISSLSAKRVLLLHDGILNVPFIVAGLLEVHIENILKDGSYNMKKNIFNNFSNLESVENITKFILELDRHKKTAENSTRLKNVLQYLKDNKFIV